MSPFIINYDLEAQPLFATRLLSPGICGVIVTADGDHPAAELFEQIRRADNSYWCIWGNLTRWKGKRVRPRSLARWVTGPLPLPAIAYESWAARQREVESLK